MDLIMFTGDLSIVDSVVCTVRLSIDTCAGDGDREAGIDVGIGGGGDDATGRDGEDVGCGEGETDVDVVLRVGVSLPS
jgi:hypothetical protein